MNLQVKREGFVVKMERANDGVEQRIGVTIFLSVNLNPSFLLKDPYIIHGTPVRDLIAPSP